MSRVFTVHTVFFVFIYISLVFLIRSGRNLKFSSNQKF